MYRLAAFRHSLGVAIDVPSWLFALAATLACGRAGIIHIERFRFSVWHGLDAASLDSACRQCGIEDVTPQERAETMDRVERWVEDNGVRMFRADIIGRLLNVTAEERIFAKIKSIGAIDEDTAGRAVRRKSDDADRKRAQRRAAGTQPRAEYLGAAVSKRKPWEELGISRATWYRAGKPASAPRITTVTVRSRDVA